MNELGWVLLTLALLTEILGWIWLADRRVMRRRRRRDLTFLTWFEENAATPFANKPHGGLCADQTAPPDPPEERPAHPAPAVRPMTSKLDAALTRLAGRRKAVVMAEATVRIAQEPIVVRESGDLSFTRGAKADPASATLLLLDPKMGAYRAVLTPPGTSWELVRKKQGPSLWKPGMKT